MEEDVIVLFVFIILGDCVDFVVVGVFYDIGFLYGGEVDIMQFFLICIDKLMCLGFGVCWCGDYIVCLGWIDLIVIVVFCFIL